MRILHLWAIALSLACLIQAPALAQIPNLPPYTGTAMMVFNKKVQEELGLGSDQLKGVLDALRKVREKYVDELTWNLKLDPGERAKLFAKVEKEGLKAIGDVLKPEQTKRLKQIEFQQRVQEQGPGVCLEADVVKELQLTDKQKKLLASISDQLLLKEAMDSFRKSLNDEQKKKLEALTGKPFAFPQPSSTPGNPGAPASPQSGQIELQQKRIGALQNREVVAALNLKGRANRFILSTYR